MTATLKPMVEATKLLLESYEAAPSELFASMQFPVSEFGDEICLDLGGLLRRLHFVLSAEYKRHASQKKQGKKATEFYAACRSASRLVRFAAEFAPKASEKGLHQFIHMCLGYIGINHTSPDSAQKFKEFFHLAKMFSKPEGLKVDLGQMP